MISTKDYFKDVPTTWVFEHYCKLQNRLHGQDIKIKSIYKPSEKTPSMVIYYKNGQYKFTDFATGLYGDKINLVGYLFKLNYAAAKAKIATDYKNRNTKEYTEVAIKEEPKFIVTACTTRKWNELDVKFWTQFGIGSRILDKYNVKPLESYSMAKDNDAFTIRCQHMYGYFKANGDLYKIYRPLEKDYKFINVLQHIQGSDQLTYSQPILIIGSSLKDIMSLDTLELNVESVAPASENTMLPKSVLSAYALKYSRIFTLFDNDNAGHKAMDKYKETFGIPGIYLKMSKDLSDSIRDFGTVKTRQYLKPLIT